MSDSYWPKLIELMDVLRGPDGCPWDREQTRETLKPMLIEEAYEVLEALDGDDPDELCEELGDLLFQVVFHSRIAKERGEFEAEDVCRRIYEKMVGRHPHVFGDENFADSQELLKNWEDLKAAEKKASGREHKRRSLLDGIPHSLPAMYKANQVSAKASRVGFDWPHLRGIGEKIAEEFAELEAAAREGDQERVQEEIGDLLFAALNASRFLQIDPETALNRANDKFARRFKALEEHFSGQGRALKDVGLEEMEEVWQALKSDPKTEKSHQGAQ
ncbi:MAG TPA: nucleoside triphosphate pyrophosphohydrolase [Acidobacteriota bacterium]|nr:nucleoside triphosphate pyrophosphohydrolase [Acidobacteriota bacterium]